MTNMKEKIGINLTSILFFCIFTFQVIFDPRSLLSKSKEEIKMSGHLMTTKSIKGKFRVYLVLEDSMIA